MEITDVSTTAVSTESWGEFVEFPLVTVMSEYEAYNNAVGNNPHLHFIAASTNAPMAEYSPIPEWYEEQEEKDATYADAVYRHPPSAEDGVIELPEGVGLSAELNHEALEHFAVE